MAFISYIYSGESIYVGNKKIMELTPSKYKKQVELTKKLKRCKFSILVRMCVIGKDICNGGIEHNCYESKKKK